MHYIGGILLVKLNQQYCTPLQNKPFFNMHSYKKASHSDIRIICLLSYSFCKDIYMLARSSLGHLWAVFVEVFSMPCHKFSSLASGSQHLAVDHSPFWVSQ